MVRVIETEREKKRKRVAVNEGVCQRELVREGERERE